MNAKTVKLINRIAKSQWYSRKEMKRHWNSLPWNQRNSYRKQFKAVQP